MSRSGFAEDTTAPTRVEAKIGDLMLAPAPAGKPEVLVKVEEYWSQPGVRIPVER